MNTQSVSSVKFVALTLRESPSTLCAALCNYLNLQSDLPPVQQPGDPHNQQGKQQ